MNTADLVMLICISYPKVTLLLKHKILFRYGIDYLDILNNYLDILTAIYIYPSNAQVILGKFQQSIFCSIRTPCRSLPLPNFYSANVKSGQMY